MSLFIDVKYLNEISSRLPLFKKKGEYLYNCRCIICGDSQTKKNKARGYFYRGGNDLFYKCHNCDVSQHFGTYLKNLDPGVYREYALERYSNGENGRAHSAVEFKFEQPTFEPTIEQPTILDTLLDRVNALPANHEVITFLESRLIPKDQYSKLYFIDDIKKIETFHTRYLNTIQTHEPRLVIPFRNAQGTLVGLSCRGLRKETLRYITVRINETDPLVFGIENIDATKPVFAVEGPLDSLFLPNAIAVGGTGFNKLDKLNISPNNLTVIIDNQPRNVEVCKVYNKLIKEGYKIFIWPDYIRSKDINEFVIRVYKQLDQNKLVGIINDNTYQGLTAQLKFNEWKKV